MNRLRRIRRLLILDHKDKADELLAMMMRDLGENLIHVSDEDIQREAEFFARHLAEASA